jgi:thiamine biosynthesis lipoprotein
MNRLGALALGLLISACAHNPALPSSSAQPKHPLEIAGRTLDGTDLRIADLRGKVVLVDIWATWCTPCRYSLPVYRDLFNQYRDRGLVVVGVNVDEGDATVRTFLQGTPLPFPILRDPGGAIPSALDVHSMPTSFLIDRRGAVRLKHEGFTPGDAIVVKARVEELLAERDAVVSDERPMMGTLFRISVVAEDSPKVRDAVAACFGHFEHVDRTMSEWRPESPLSEVNRQAGVTAVHVPDDLYEVLEIARRVSEESEGAFDATWAALWGLWKFDGSDRVPTAEEISNRLPLVGWRDLVLEPQSKTAFLRRKGMAVGLGGVAKGYALALAAQELRRRGFSDFLLYAGGQAYASGRKDTGPWRSGIQDPRAPPGDLLATLDIENMSLSTSGDYEHFFLKDGVRYHHIIDLRTGYPARGVRSATVLATDPTLADAYSTAAFVMGSEGALSFARDHGFELLLVDEAGHIVMTDGMASRLTMRHPPRP